MRKSWSRDELLEIFEHEDRSVALLTAARWPYGIICPKCGAKNKASPIAGRSNLLTCIACRKCQFTATSGTPLHGMRVHPGILLRTIYLQRIEGMTLTASHLQRRMNVSYPTCQKLLRTISRLESDMPEMFDELLRLLTPTPMRKSA